MLEEREQEQPFNQIISARLEGGRIVDSSVEELPRDAYSEEPLEVEKEYAEEEEEERPPEKIHPALRTMLDELAADYIEQVVIQLRDDMTLPRFPEPAIDEPRDSETNRQVMQRTEELIRETTNRRAENYERVAQELSESYEFELLDTYWLVNAMLVKLPLAAVSDLAEREDVLSVEPRYTHEQPDDPKDVQTVEPRYTHDFQPDESGDAVRINRDVAGGRSRINSDVYFRYADDLATVLGLGTHIGLIDTGVRSTHDLLSHMYDPLPPAFAGLLGDCVEGGDDCLTGGDLNPMEPDLIVTLWGGHGTNSAAILSANDSHDDAYRGVTPIRVDSWKIFEDTVGAIDLDAALKAFQNAVRERNLVIAAVFQYNVDDTSAISKAADNAFDTGVATIAGNGNFGPRERTVKAPANAHKAIGVGAVDVIDQTTPNYQSRGPTRDGRIKPDIQAPTHTKTAGARSDSHITATDGTSGATPYAAGAAALARLFLHSLLHPPSTVIDPGQLYAYMILSGGNRATIMRPDTTRGAGPLRLPSLTDGRFWFGKVFIRQGEVIDIPLEIDARWYFLDGALWWDENFSVPATEELHNDIDLYLVDPSGEAVAWSTSVSGVFEKARFGIGVIMNSGDWKLRIIGHSVPGGEQRVYWAAHATFT
jgi:serine protease AprX